MLLLQRRSNMAVYRLLRHLLAVFGSRRVTSLFPQSAPQYTQQTRPKGFGPLLLAFVTLCRVSVARAGIGISSVVSNGTLTLLELFFQAACLGESLSSGPSCGFNLQPFAPQLRLIVRLQTFSTLRRGCVFKVVFFPALSVFVVVSHCPSGLK